MNPKDILLFIKALASEKKVSTEIIFDAVERTMVQILQKELGEDAQIIVHVDRKSGDIACQQNWEVIDDEEYKESEFKNAYISLSVAKHMETDAKLGNVIEDHIDIENNSRIGAHNFKQTLMRFLRDIDRDKTAKRFEERIGELVSAEVKKLLREFLILELQDGTELMLPRTEMIPREMIRLGDRVKACVIGINDSRQGPVVMVSRSSNEMIKSLFTLEVPEITEGAVEIKSAAREPGVRAKIAVKANDKRIDPIGACVGMRGVRVQSISTELNGERIDIIDWDDDPAKLAIAAIAPAQAQSVYIDESSHVIDLIVGEDQLSQAIGKSGQNVRLASELIGWEINISSQESYEQSKIAITSLGLSDSVTQTLLDNGFNNIGEITNDQVGFNALEALDNEAKQQILDAIKHLNQDQTSLDSLLSIDEATIIHLESAGIHSVEDLLNKGDGFVNEIEGIDPEVVERIFAEAQMLI